MQNKNHWYDGRFYDVFIAPNQDPLFQEINENERIGLLKEVSEIADIVIIGDYLAPGPKDFGGYLTRIIEFLAGRDHYRNYLNFIANGGIPELAGRSGVKIINTIDTQQSHNQIYILSKS